MEALRRVKAASSRRTPKGMHAMQNIKQLLKDRGGNGPVRLTIVSDGSRGIVGIVNSIFLVLMNSRQPLLPSIMMRLSSYSNYYSGKSLRMIPS